MGLLSKRIVYGLLLSAALLLFITPATPASAATFTLTDCLEASLLAALNTANSNGQNDTVTLLAGCTYTLTGTLFVQADNQHTLTIQGSGAAISGGGTVRPLHINTGAVVALNNLTVQQGKSEDLMNGGGLINEGRTTISNSTFSNNVAYLGAAIVNENGILTVTNSTFDSNENESGGSGAGIANTSGTVTITGSTFSNNQAFKGSGIYNFEDGTVTVIGSTFSGNEASSPFYGSAIYNNRGQVTITGSGFYDNIGGGLLNEHGTLSLSRSTVSGSDIEGIRNETGTLNVSLSTISDNAGDGIYSYNGTVSINLSTIAGNNRGFVTTGNGTISYSILAYNTLLNCWGINITGTGVNWIEDGPCDLTNMPGVLTGDPQLGPLQLNAPGSTKTRALLPASLAINAFKCFTSGSTDQRGVPLPQGKACDLGAYEYDGLLPPRIADDFYTTPINTTLVVAAPGVLDNDDGMPLPTVIPTSGEAEGWGGSFNLLADGSFTYTPPSGFGNTSGVATFSYTITNGQNPDVTAVVHITVVSPANTAPQQNYYTVQPTFTWNPVSGATGYEVQIASNPAFTGAHSYTPGNVTNFIPPTPDNGTWYWRVRSLYGTTTGNWSAAVSFIVKVP